MRTLVQLTAVIGIALCAAPVQAQISLSATIGLSQQFGGNDDVPYLGPAFGGTSVASLAMVDVAVGSHVTIGGEASFAGDISGAQRERVSGGDNVFVSDHHDTVFSGILKIGTPTRERVRAVGVFGGGIAARHTERNGTFVSSSPSIGNSPVQENIDDLVPSVTAGVDVSVGFSEHLAVLGAFRIHQLFDDDRSEDGVTRRGVSSTILRYSAGLRIGF